MEIADKDQIRQVLEVEEAAQAKAALLDELVKLREMKAQPGIFTAEEISEKQAAVDKLIEDGNKSP